MAPPMKKSKINSKTSKTQSSDQSPSQSDTEIMLKRKQIPNLQTKKADTILPKIRTTTRPQESLLFTPARTYGVVNDCSVPFCLSRLGTETFLAVSCGHSYQIYDTNKLRIVYMSRLFADKIVGLLTLGDLTITSFKSSGNIVIWDQGVEKGRFSTVSNNIVSTTTTTTNNNNNTGGARLLCTQGKTWLITSTGSVTKVFDLVNMKEQGILGSESGSDSDESIKGKVTTLTTIPTYLNKILIGTDTGDLYLFNVKTLKKVHHFKGIRELVKSQSKTRNSNSSDSYDSESDYSVITALTPHPKILDVVAVGFESGKILLLNTAKDRVMKDMVFDQKFGSTGVNSLSFRSDNTSFSQLVSCTDSGYCIWDLEQKKVDHVEPFTGANNNISNTNNNSALNATGLTKTSFLDGHPLMISQGRNALFMYVFDSPDGKPRLLRSRIGTVGPIRSLKFYTDSGTDLIVTSDSANGSAGSLGRISTIQQHQNSEFSQKPGGSLVSKKHSNIVINSYGGAVKQLSPIIDSSFSSSRHLDWPAIVTVHKDCDTAYLWSAHMQSLVPKTITLPKHALTRKQKIEGIKAPFATSVAVSKCGNWVVIGYANGGLHRYAVQSQQHRMEFARKLDQNNQKFVVAHNKAVTSIGFTEGMQVLSASNDPEDPVLRVWNSKTGALASEIKLPHNTGVLFLRHHGSLVALALSDGSVAVVDLFALRLVRHFKGISSRIADIAFRADGRWIAVASAVDCKLHIFDLPSVRCIDILRFSSPIIAIEFSPNNVYLLTTHAKSAHYGAIHAWANKHLFAPGSSVTAGGSLGPILSTQAIKEVEMDRLPGSNGSVLSVKGGPSESTKIKNKVSNLLKKIHNVTSDNNTDNSTDSDRQDTNLNSNEDDNLITAQRENIEENYDNSDDLVIEDDTSLRALFGAAKTIDFPEPADSGSDDEDNDDDDENFQKTLTLSTIPPLQWENVLHLEEIKERNRVIQPEQEKKKAPFFLSSTFSGNENALINGPESSDTAADSVTTSGNTTTDLGNESFFGGSGPKKSSSSAVVSSVPKSKILGEVGAASFHDIGVESDDLFLSPLQKLLRKKNLDAKTKTSSSSSSSEAIIFDEILDFLSKQTASGIHLALCSLGPIAMGSQSEIDIMIQFFEYHMRKGHHADLLQVYLQLFLLKHHAYIDHSKNSDSLKRLTSVQKSAWSNLDSQMQKNICFLKMLTQTQTQW